MKKILHISVQSAAQGFSLSRVAALADNYLVKIYCE